jgi:hypothetical protein
MGRGNIRLLDKKHRLGLHRVLLVLNLLLLRQRVIIHIIQVMYHSNHYKSAALLVPIGRWSQLLVGLLRLGALRR